MEQNNITPAYYTIDQAALILQISKTTIYRGIKKGLIPKSKFCGKILIPAYFFKEGYEKDDQLIDADETKHNTIIFRVH